MVTIFQVFLVLKFQSKGIRNPASPFMIIGKDHYWNNRFAETQKQLTEIRYIFIGLSRHQIFW